MQHSRWLVLPFCRSRIRCHTRALFTPTLDSPSDVRTNFFNRLPEWVGCTPPLFFGGGLKVRVSFEGRCETRSVAVQPETQRQSHAQSHSRSVRTKQHQCRRMHVKTFNRCSTHRTGAVRSYSTSSLGVPEHSCRHRLTLWTTATAHWTSATAILPLVVWSLQSVSSSVLNRIKTPAVRPSSGPHSSTIPSHTHYRTLSLLE